MVINEFLDKLNREFEKLKNHIIEEKGITVEYNISRRDFCTNIHMRVDALSYDLSVNVKDEKAHYSELCIDDIVKAYVYHFKNVLNHEIFADKLDSPQSDNLSK